MEYAIKILTDEADLIEKALKETESWKNHPEAHRDRTNKLKQIEKAVELLKG